MVTNPHTLFSHISPDTLYFMVLDLKDAFFTILYTTPHSPYLPSPGQAQTRIHLNTQLGPFYHKGSEIALIFLVKPFKGTYEL